MDAINSAPESRPVDDATVRLTVEIPADLSEHIARCCASRGVKMVHILREVIEERFPLR